MNTKIWPENYNYYLCLVLSGDFVVVSPLDCLLLHPLCIWVGDPGFVVEFSASSAIISLRKRMLFGLL